MRWRNAAEAFQRKGVKLEVQLDPSIPTFRFDYQKVQQAAAICWDNSLKHTPPGGNVDFDSAAAFLGEASSGSGAKPGTAAVSACRDRNAWKSA